MRYGSISIATVLQLRHNELGVQEGVKMKKLHQNLIDKQLGISKSYLSMVLSGQRKATPELAEKLQSIPGVHKVVNNYIQSLPSKQHVAGSNPARDATNYQTTSFNCLI